MTNRYPAVAIALHWAIAALIIANILIAELTEDLPRAERGAWMGWHFSFGLTVLVLSFVRYAWRVRHSPPPYDPAIPNWQIALGTATHRIFYFLILALPITGWLMVSQGGPISYFGLFDWPALPVDETLGDFGHEAHEIMGTIMIWLAVLHILGALKHQFVDRVPFLARMGLGTPRRRG